MNIVRYQRVQKLESVRKREGAVVAKCLTEGGGLVQITISSCAPDVVRFRVNPIPSTGEGEGPNLVQTFDLENSSFRLEAEGEQVKLETGKLRIRIQKDPWQVKIFDSDEKLLTEENITDSDVSGETRIHPLGFSRSEDGRMERIFEALKLGPEEHIYGFGEKFTDFDKRGQEIVNWTVDAMGCETEKSYKNVPLFLSSEGYGIFINSSSFMTHRVGSETIESYSLELEDGILDLFFIYGPSLKHVLDRYAGLTGRAAVPPKWSFGLWMSRACDPEAGTRGYESRVEVERVCSELRDRKIPCDVIHLDPNWMRSGHQCDLEWDREAFPAPEEMIDKLHEMSFKISLWEQPYVPPGTEAFEEGDENGYFLQDERGSTYIQNELCPKKDFFEAKEGAIVDFSNQDACEWWKEKHRKLFRTGVDVFKTDFGEQVPKDAKFENGLTGKTMHNYYPVLYNETVFEATEEEKGEGIVWGRSAYAGSQKYPTNWGGDAKTSFRSMASTLRGGLSYGMSGCPFWSHDIGGFAPGKPDPILYVRWAQFGLLSSHSRCHGLRTREPWEYGKKAEKIFKKYANLRYRLIPFLYSYANIASLKGLPVLRPMVLEFQEDPVAQRLDTQYMLGKEILVAPVFNSKGRKKVYLPEDTWYDYWTGEKHEGPKNLDLELELDEFPIFVRSDSIIPTGPTMQYVGEKKCDPITLDTYLKKSAEFALYEEEEKPIEIQATREEKRTKVEAGSTDTRFGLRLHGSRPPTKINVDGEEIDRSKWTYKPKTRLLEIEPLNAEIFDIHL